MRIAFFMFWLLILFFGIVEWISYILTSNKNKKEKK